MEIMGHKVDATILWIIQLTLTTAFKSTVRLSPTIAEVLENGNVTLTCAYNGTQHQTFSSWRTAADSQQNTFISMSDENCKATGYLNSAELYDWDCLGNSTFALTLKKVGLSQHQSKWTCSQNNIHSNEITIFVKVPIESVTVNKENNDTITSIENSTLQFKCSTSYCRPAPTVTWVLDSGTLDRKDDKVIVSGNTTQQTNTNDDNLISLTSTISFRVNRSVNGWSIYCSGRNIQNRNTAISTATKLNIIYPPDGPPAIEGFSNGSGYTVIDGQLGNLSCSITGGNPLAELAWHCYNVSLPPVTTDTTVRSIVTWRASRDQNNTCECTSNHTSTTIISTEVNVIVQYPPSLPVFTMASVPVYKIVNIIVNNTLSIKCTSNSKPIPTYKWNAPDSSISFGQSLYIGNISKADNGTYNCTAENRMFPSKRDNVTGSNTTSIEVNVLFSPSIPIFRYGSSNGIVIESNSLDVVENDTLTVACSSIANPEPEISWSGETTGRDVLNFASISADFNKTCYATNTMNETVGESRIGSTEAAISVRVLYPPRKPTIRYFTTRGHQADCLSNNFSVIEKTSFSLSCVAISRPEPTYSWYGPITSTIADLKIIGINRVQKGEYSCNAFNTMKRTFGSSQSGKHARNIYLNILYPPTIGHLTNQTVIEGSPFNILCPVNPGNPEQYTVTWTRNGDTKQWNTQTLLLSNTHRKDHMIYTCTVYNTMKPSCENESKGKASRSFHLNVVYKTYVKEFHVKGFVGLSEVTVNENDSLEFRCSTESNPKSSIKIGFNEKILISKSSVNTLTYSVSKATCLHEGVYKCFGNNTYNNEEPSVKHVTLRVNCFPRPSPTVRIRDKIYTTTHVTATLSFTALAYPVPYQSSFIWQRKIGLMWSTLANSKQIKIIRSGLLTNLTIVNVTKSDFGKYRLSIENAVGIFEQIFYIAAKAPPDTPSDFKVLEERTTDTSVTVKWKPGLNHGSEQHFILQYKKVTDDEWISVNVTHINVSTINYTIKGLLSVTRYKANITAMTDVGSSDNLFIIFQTKGKPLIPQEIEIIPESVRETSVSLQWRPGSDGGAPQTFILKYSKFVDNEWTNISFCDNDDQLQRRSINNLSSGSQYKLVILSSNRFGTSDESETITFQTKDTTSDKPKEQSSIFIGLLAGLSVSSLLNVILTILVIRLWKRRSFQGHMKVPDKAKKETAVLRASYHSFIDESGTSNSGAYEDVKNEAGQDLAEIPKSYTQLGKKTDQVKRNVSDDKLVLYEEIKIPRSGEESLQKKEDGYEVPVSKMDKKMSASECKSIRPGAAAETKTNRKKYETREKGEGKTDPKMHTNPTDYMNLEELSTSKS